jgi:hypothetical protein
MSCSDYKRRLGLNENELHQHNDNLSSENNKLTNLQYVVHFLFIYALFNDGVISLINIYIYIHTYRVGKNSE